MSWYATKVFDTTDTGAPTGGGGLDQHLLNAYGQRSAVDRVEETRPVEDHEGEHEQADESASVELPSSLEEQNDADRADEEQDEVVVSLHEEESNSLEAAVQVDLEQAVAEKADELAEADEPTEELPELPVSLGTEIFGEFKLPEPEQKPAKKTTKKKAK